MPPRNARLARRTADVLSATPEEAIADAEIAGGGRMFGISDKFPRLIEVGLDRLHRNPDQPRKTFDQAELDALAASIDRHGLQQPILVQPEGQGGGHYRIVAGERRARAHEILGKATILAIICSGDPDEVALVENIQRVDLNALEVAGGYRRLIDRHGHTQEELGQIVGRSQAEISSVLRLLALPEAVQAEYHAVVNKVSRSTLIEVARADDPDEQVRLWRMAKAGATLEAVREARQSQRPREAGKSVRRVATIIRQTTKGVAELSGNREMLAPEHRDQLREIRDAINALLDGQGTA